MTKEEFIAKATEIYGDAYDYSMASEHDIENDVNIPIKCPKHGIFWESPYQHLHARFGCFECHKDKNWKPVNLSF